MSWIKPFLACAAAVLLFGSFTITPRAADDPDYVFILRARGNPYWIAMVDGIEETAKQNNIHAIVYQLSDDKAAEEQLNICADAIQRKPKFLSLSSATSTVSLQCLKNASTQGIIVADMDATFSTQEAQTAGFPLAYSVGSDNFLIGNRAGERAAQIEPGVAPHILVLEGFAGSLPGKKRADGFRDTIKKLKPQAEIVSMAADWDRSKAMTMATDALQRDPNLSLIYAVNDLMGLGAAEAIKVAGKEKQVKIIAVDGTADGRRAVEEGRIDSTVAQLPYFIGKRAVELAIAAVRTGKTNVTEVTPTPLLTKQVLEEKTDPDLQYVR